MAETPTKSKQEAHERIIKKQKASISGMKEAIAKIEKKKLPRLRKNLYDAEYALRLLEGAIDGLYGFNGGDD